MSMRARIPYLWGVGIEFTRAGIRPAFLAALLVALALMAGYATADDGHRSSDPTAPVPLTKVSTKASAGDGVQFAKLAVTTRLRPSSRRAVAPPSIQQQAPTQQRQQPATAVQQPATRTPNPTPSPQRSNGSNSFDSSG
jgi:hypothetical protein